MGMLIKKINKKKLEKVSENRPQLPNTPQLTNCNCRNKQNCPLNGKCLESSLVYEAELKTEDDTFNYIGFTEGTIKDRITKHKTSFKHPHYRNNTELSKKVWELKEGPANFIINWKILSRARAYSGGQNCDLCITEKHLILKSKFINLLNSRTELISKCRHMNKHMLKKSL